MAGLLERGYPVIALGRASTNIRLAERLSNILRWLNIPDPEKRLSAIEVDLSKKHMGLDDDMYSHLCVSACKIIHCASDTSFAERNRERVIATNINGLTPLLSFAADSKTEQFYYVSTAYACGIYEGLCIESPIRSDKFYNVYEESKAQAEGIILNFCELKGIPLTILRPSIVYGHSKSGMALKFNALYYAVKSLMAIRDIFIKDIVEQGGDKSGKWGFNMDSDGILHVVLKIYLPQKGTVNLIPIDYFVESVMNIIESSESKGIYHITSSNPPDITTLIEYSERFLKMQGVQAVWDGNNPSPNPAEELFDRFLEQYRPISFRCKNL